MAKKVIQAQMQQRRDTAAQWAASNPVLLEGELGIVTDDPNLYKIGDGVTAWNDLKFRGFDGTLVQTTGDSENAAMSQKAVTAKLTELESEVSQIYDAEYSLSDFDDLKAINVNGEVINNEYFRTLTNIPVSEGDVVECVGIKSDNPNYCSIAAYNKLGQFESSSSVFAQYSDSYRYIVPSGIVSLRLSTLRGVENVGVTIRRPTALTTILESISEKGLYQTNGEYIRVYTDQNGYVLWGIRGDGSIEFSKGVPSAIKEPVNRRKDIGPFPAPGGIKSLCWQEYCDGCRR